MEAEKTDGRHAERWFASYPGEKSETSERTGASERVISLSSLNSQSDTAREDARNDRPKNYVGRLGVLKGNSDLPDEGAWAELTVVDDAQWLSIQSAGAPLEEIETAI
jgi:hypothetical protein